MADTTLPLLSAGSAIADGDLFITRQGADTSDKKVTGTQLKTYMAGTYVPYTGATGAVDLGSNALITTTLRADGSGGMLVESNSGTDVALFGAGGGAGATFYDGVIFNANTADTLAYHNSSKALNSASISNSASITTTLIAGTLTSEFTGVVPSKLVYDSLQGVTVDNDMDLTLTPEAVLVHLAPDANGYLIWGINAFAENQVFVLVNTSDTHSIILEHSSGSTAEAPIFCPNNANYTLEPRASTYIYFDVSQGKYYVINQAQAATTPTNSFETIAVSGQSDVVADSATDTLTLAAGTGISITTNAGTDTITITNTASAGSGRTTGQVFASIMNVGVI
jgi:hypothetical protein